MARAGQIVSKDDLIAAGWKDVAVSDNSLEQAISNLRRVLGDGCIETAARRGYRFTAAVERRAPRETDAGLDALLAPHRAFIEGRAALETLEAGHVAKARAVFERAVAGAPEHPSSHVGLANAAFMQGRIKVTGNMGKLMSLMPLTQSAEYKAIVEKLDQSTEY